MHVSVLGAGALGRVFGVRLARVAGVSVEFVVREARLAERGPFRVESAEGGEAHVLDAPARVPAVSPHADAVIACVRGDGLDDALALASAGPDVPVVLTTPMLPRTYARVRAALGDRARATQSSVTGYVRPDGVTRYWISQTAKTLLDDPRRGDAACDALVGALVRAGIDARLQLGVHESNPATATVFLPVLLALGAAGSSDALVADAALSDTMLRACDETRAIAEHVGKVALWAGLLTRFLGPYTLKMGVALAKRRSLEAVAFVEGHLAGDMRGQNAAMAREASAIAEEKGLGHEALDALVARSRGDAC
jgi:2-dehydropantoate 2-reductase